MWGGKASPVEFSFFLSNDHNTSHLINLLREEVEECGMASCRANDDAVQLIVTTPISLAEEQERVTVVSEAVDLLVLSVGVGFQLLTTCISPNLVEKENPTSCTIEAAPSIIT
ncbi:hypothetical protein JTB14_025889 [Gonioctena quinquepunctata]|nr:hypothetical protein JTB14_025889 [Gonioctena quinquepunctata]